MDLSLAYVFKASWIFFGAWGMVVMAVGVIAFGRDLRRNLRHSENSERS